MLKPILKPALAVMLAFLVSACLTHRSLEPLPANTRTDLESRGFKVGAPLYIRAFKQENELEVWLRRDNGDAAFRARHENRHAVGDLHRQHVSLRIRHDRIAVGRSTVLWRDGAGGDLDH